MLGTSPEGSYCSIRSAHAGHPWQRGPPLESLWPRCHEDKFIPPGVPYLPNQAEIAAPVTASREIFSLLMVVILIGFVLLVGTIDWLFYRHMDKQAKHLDPSRLAVIGRKVIIR